MPRLRMRKNTRSPGESSVSGTGCAARCCSAAVRGMATPTRSCTYRASPLQSKPAASAPPNWYRVPISAAAACAIAAPSCAGAGAVAGTLLHAAASSATAMASAARKLSRAGGRLGLRRRARSRETRQRPDTLVGVALHAASTAANCAEHGLAHGTRRDGTVGNVPAAQQWIHQRHEGACRKLQRARLAAPAQQQCRLQDVERCEARLHQPLLHLALGAQVEVARAGVRAHARYDDKALGIRRPGGARKRQHALDVDRAKALLRAGLAQGRAKTAQRNVAAGALELRLEVLELHDAIGESRMLTPERSP